MKRILITGGAGFIGSHLAERLLNEGNEIIVIDNFFTGDKNNIKHLQDNPNFELIRHDITRPIYLEVDQIYNLACPASPIHYEENPIKTIKCSTLGVINMLGLAKRTGARILQASTSEVYGSPNEHPQKEEYWGNVNALGLRACYDEGKRVAETLCIDYHRREKVDIRIVRIFNTYGPKMSKNDGRVISNFITQALKNRDLTVHGDGSQTRSFCFVEDIINGLIKMMNQNSIGPINLGNPQEITIKELAEKILKLTNSSSKLSFESFPIDDPIRRKPEITKARTALGFEPKVELEEGLQKTIEFFKNIR